MDYILKADPTRILDDGSVEVTLPAFYGGKAISIGDRAFLWFTEDAGGRGLVGSGIVTRVTPRGKNYSLRVRLDHRISTEFGVANIKALRDDDTSPGGLIARKLYKHAHNKVAEVSEAEARLLQAHLAPNA